MSYLHSNLWLLTLIPILALIPIYLSKRRFVMERCQYFIQRDELQIRPKSTSIFSPASLSISLKDIDETMLGSLNVCEKTWKQKILGYGNPGIHGIAIRTSQIPAKFIFITPDLPETFLVQLGAAIRKATEHKSIPA